MKEATERAHFLQHMAQTTPFPMGLEIEKAEGIYLYGKNGQRYMDLISGIAVSNLGHGNPVIKQAVKEQLDRYTFIMVYGEFVQREQVALAKRLTELLPEKLETVYFVNSGTEANEAALKLAKRWTGRTEIVSCYRSYHGSTHGSLSVSGNEAKKQAFRPLLPDVRFIQFDESADLDAITEKTACVIIEPIQGDAGVRIPAPTYFKNLRQRCNETGTLLIMDEIQTGFGRTGALFAFEHFGVVPDILTMGKALGGGMPMGALATSHEMMNAFAHDPMLGHITTFGGHPVCCAAALASLHELTRGSLIDEVKEKGAFFKNALQHPKIREIRSIGLMFALELESEDLVQKLIKRGLALGIIGFNFLSTRNCYRLAPPLTISYEELKLAAEKIIQALDTCEQID